jgi:glycosyltransferase involved in cell wall biosynthesis
MRIVVVLPSFWPAIGGCEIHTRELVTHLSRRHQIEVITAISRDEDKERGKLFMWSPLLAAARHAEHYMDGAVRVTRVGMPRYWKLCLYLLLRICGTERLPPALCRQAAKLFVAGYQWQLRKLVGKPDLIHGIHQDCAWFGFAALRVAADLGIPYAYTPVSHIYSADKAIAGEYAANRQGAEADLPPVLRGVFGGMFARTCAGANVVFTMTDAEKQFFEERKFNRNVHTIGVGPVLASRPALDVRETYGIPADSPLILFLGRINLAKGVSSVLEATRMVWREAPEACFLFVGPFERGSEALFASRRERRVITTGAVDLECKTGALQACDLLCLPSVNESLGGVYLEAWAFGKPVVGATIPPFLELSGNGQGGVAVEPTPQGVARGILLLLRDRETGRRMGAWGRERVRNQYSWEVIAGKVEACYSDILRSKDEVAGSAPAVVNT